MRFSIKLGNTEFWTEFSIGNEQDSYIVKVINMGLLTFIIILFFSDAIYPFSFFLTTLVPYSILQISSIVPV